jgi:transcriptional regulator with XRE-family HTH domain
MGSPRSPKPERLAEKLLQIRLALGLSQNEMLVRLGMAEEYFRSRISAYELGNREPHLPILLRYARSVGISTDVLIDDEMNLPKKLLRDAARTQNMGKPTSRNKRKR